MWWVQYNELVSVPGLTLFDRPISMGYPLFLVPSQGGEVN